MCCGRSLPPFTNEKNTTSTPDLRRHMTPPHLRFPPLRIFPHDASRTEREFVRARRRPGLPRDQFSGPWLFSTAEARTINSSSSSRNSRFCLAESEKETQKTFALTREKQKKNTPKKHKNTHTQKNKKNTKKYQKNTNVFFLRLRAKKKSSKNLSCLLRAKK